MTVGVLQEIVLALGAALLLANVAVVVKERRRPPEDAGPRPNMRLVALNVCIGLVMSVWGLASLVT